MGAVAVTALAVVIGFVMAVVAPHGLGGSAPTPTAPAQKVFNGTFPFGGTTMICPGKTTAASGDTCVIPITAVAGAFNAALRWDTPDHLSIGLRDSSGHDVTTLLTDASGSLDLSVAHLAAGSYQVRVVNADHTGPLNFSVGIT